MIETIKIDKDWYSRLVERGFTIDAVFDEGQNEDLKVKLLSFGGEAVVLPCVEPDKVDIMTKGYIKANPVVEMRLGKPSNCHANTADLYTDKQIDTIVTGYALSSDGVWRQHTWGKNKGVIVETTEYRVGYFGFDLDEKQAEKFCFENY